MLYEVITGSLKAPGDALATYETDIRNRLVNFNGSAASNKTSHGDKQFDATSLEKITMYVPDRNNFV